MNLKYEKTFIKIVVSEPKIKLNHHLFDYDSHQIKTMIISISSERAYTSTTTTTKTEQATFTVDENENKNQEQTQIYD